MQAASFTASAPVMSSSGENLPSPRPLMSPELTAVSRYLRYQAFWFTSQKPPAASAGAPSERQSANVSMSTEIRFFMVTSLSFGVVDAVCQFNCSAFFRSAPYPQQVVFLLK